MLPRVGWLVAGRPCCTRSVRRRQPRRSLGQPVRQARLGELHRQTTRADADDAASTRRQNDTLIGHGSGTSSSIQDAPSSAMFFMKFT